MWRLLTIVFCMGVAATVTGCGVRSGTDISDSSPPAAVSTDQLVFAEPAVAEAEFAKLAATMSSPTRDNLDVWAFRVQGGPVFIHIALHVDFLDEKSGERRTVWHSETVWPDVSSVENDSAEQPRYTFSRFPVHVVVQGNSPPSIAVQHSSARRDGELTTRSDRIHHLPIYLPRSLEEVRLIRSHSMVELKASQSFTTGFVRLRLRDTTRGILNRRSPMAIGDTVELFKEWPVANWGPDDSPLSLVVTATRLDLPNDFDRASLQSRTDLLRRTIDANPADCESRLMLAICLETLASIEPMDDVEVLQNREEAVDNMRQAVARQPYNSVYRDRLQREMTNLGYACSKETGYAAIPALMEEMLQLRPGFDGYDDASILIGRCVLAVRRDDTVPDADKQQRQHHYSHLASDYLRRGLQFELDHGGIELLNRRRRWLAAQGSSDATSNPALQVEFETSRGEIEKNIARLSVEQEQRPTDGEPCYLLAAAHNMLVRVSADEYSPAETAAREQHASEALEFARQAVAREPGNDVYRRRLRRQLLDYAGTAPWRRKNSAATPQLVREALQYDPQFVDFVVGADCIWRAAMHVDTSKESDEAVTTEVESLRKEFASTLSDAIDWVRTNRPSESGWLVEQLAIAIPNPTAEWPEVVALFDQVRGASARP